MLAFCLPLTASESLLLAFCLPLSAFSLGCERSFYPGFFDENDYPKSNFRKIMHIHVTHAIVDRYPKVKFVWAHVGLSQELATLHPAVHARILEVFFERFSTNLWLDTSWDVLAKQNFVRGYGASNRPRPHRIPEEIGTEIVTEIVLVPPHPPPTPLPQVNYDGQPIENLWSSWASEDLTDDALFDMPKWTSARERLDKIWQAKKNLISKTVTTLTGPSHKMAVLLDLMERYPDKFLPGTDYVASFGTHDDFPGYTPLTGTPNNPTHKREDALTDRVTGDGSAAPDLGLDHDRGGCHKTEMTHSEQITDTSSLNMFFNDELFSAMVLGTNFFRVAGLATQFAAPPLCRNDPDTPLPTATVGWKPGAAVATTTQTPTTITMLGAPAREDARDGAETASVTSLGRLGVPSQAVVPLMLLAAMLLAGLVYRVGVTQGQKSAVDPDYALHQDGVKPLLP